MKKLLLLFILSMYSILSIFAFGDVNQSIVELDSYIEQKDFYIQQKEDRIIKLKDSLRVATDDDRKVELYSSLFEEFKSYIHDSAFVYAQKHLNLAEEHHNEKSIMKAKIQIGFCYLSSGLFKEAHDILNNIHNIKGADNDIKKDYYVLIARLYYDMADYSYGEIFSQGYIDQGIQYCDSAINYLSIEDTQLWSIVGLKRMQQKKFVEAIDAFQVLLHSSQIDDHTYAIATSSIGFMYISLGDIARGKYYLSQAAIGDIKSATKEAVALQNLARVLYETGDVKRANRYIRMAMEDANFYNARHRKIEISAILPMIEKERSDMVESQKNNLQIFALTVSLLFILLLTSTIVIYKQVKKLKAARHLIVAQNESLSLNNSLLTEANEIKDEYIVQTLYSKSEYIDNLDKLHKLVARKLIVRQYDDINEHMKAFDVKKERENMFSSFDQTFLKLFPSYIEEYNKLFETGDRIIPNDNTLTVEQRIFALIRLGISENEKIANFLDYSVNTINTYKTKVKNRSSIDNDLFEDKILAIKTVGQTQKKTK